MSQLVYRIADLCIELEKALSRTAVRRILQSAAQEYGARFHLFSMRTGRSVSPPQQIVVSDYPAAWRRYYNERDAHTFDPVINRAIQVMGAFRWDDLHSDERQLALLCESIRNGMQYGFSCSDHGSDGSIAVLSFCGHQPILRDSHEWERAMGAAALLASATIKAILRIVQDKSQVVRQRLSGTERRALTLKATGATDQEVATALDVKRRTVRFYLDRAAEKLGVGTRREAILKAVAEGIVDIRQVPPFGFREETDEIDD